MREFKDIHEIVRRFTSSSLSNGVDVSAMSEFQFIALIYALDTGGFDITGASERRYVTYLKTSGQTEDTNWALDIANNLPYSKDEFITLLNKMK